MSQKANSTYTEDLTLQRLGTNHVGARFVFRSQWVPEDRHWCQDHEGWTVDDRGQEKDIAGKLCHFEAIFPRAVGVLLDRFKVHDLSLQMSKGRWDAEAWGNGPGDGASGEYTPGGAEMWAKLPKADAWDSWVGLRRSLSGLYCSSLDAMDETRVHEPVQMSMPGETFPGKNSATIVLRGTLPREPVCTENLIPLVKMLPCRSKTGLGRLLHPTRLFQADYHSISVRAKGEFSPDGSATSLTLEQTVLVVIRPRPHLPSAISETSRDAAAANEGSTAHPKSVGDWSISSLLLPPSIASDWSSGGTREESTGRSAVLEGCPIASRSAIHVLDGIGGIGLAQSSIAEGYVSVRGNGSRVEQASTAVPEATTTAERSCTEAPEESPEGACSAELRATAASAASGLEESIGHGRICGSGLHPKVETVLLSTSPTDRQTDEGAVVDFLNAKLWNAMSSKIACGSADGAASGEFMEGAQEADGGRGRGVEATSSSAVVATLHHFLAGRGGTRGSSISHLVNAHPTADAYVDFLQPVPYFMVPLARTLRARVVRISVEGGDPNQRSSSEDATFLKRDIPETTVTGERDQVGLFAGSNSFSSVTSASVNLAGNITFTPGSGRRPAVLEVRLWIPASSTLVLGFDFFKRFLALDDFPPDPSRGFDVPPPLGRFSFLFPEDEQETPGTPEGGDAGSNGRRKGATSSKDEVVLEETSADDGGSQGCPNGEFGPHTGDYSRFGVEAGNSADSRVVYVYGEAGLLDTPEPDFSMPFNVITFTSTVITFFLGTMINLLVRKSVAKRRKSTKKKSGENGDGNSETDEGNEEQQGGGLVRRAWRRWKRRRGRRASGQATA